MPLNVISSCAAPRILNTVKARQVVTGRYDLEKFLETPSSQTILDLIGHSVEDLLQLGDWVIDSSALPWFRVHASAFRRFEAVRLIGCHTASSAEARRTICAIGDVLGVEVYGATGFIFDYHYNAAGFDPAWRFLLGSAQELPRRAAESDFKRTRA